MNNVAYDIQKLRLLDEMDVDSALAGFKERQEFFDGLTGFLKNPGKNLEEYGAYVIFNRDEIRISFLNELEKMKGELIRLGMSGLASDLKYLEEAALKKDTGAFNAELAGLRGRMRRISKHLTASVLIVPNQKEAASVQKQIVLAVDDKPALLCAVADMLSEEFKVMTVTNGLAALSAISRHPPALFLLDIEMPEMDGFELAGLIRGRRRFKNTPIIFLTAKGGRDDVISALTHGGNDYIVKPVERELLIGKVRKYIGAD